MPLFGTSCMYMSDISDIVTILVPGVDGPRLQPGKSTDGDQLLGDHQTTLPPHQAQQPQ